MQADTLGDVHLGKKFEVGVPLHRRGERERMVFNDFYSRLMTTSAELHVQMGDIFDKMYVPNSVVYRAAMAYREARRRNPGTVYAVIRGNHDASRDADKVSSFQVFSELVRPFGVCVVDETPVLIGEHVLIPWHPFMTAKQMVEEHADLIKEATFAYGHWDVVMGQDNQLPAAELKALGIEKAFTGHDHLARDLELEGLPVRVTGSMQPYSHGEDPTGELYVTLPLADLAGKDLTHKCVRVLLEPGEELTEPVDCLQLTRKVIGTDDAVDVSDVDFEAFDFKALYEQAVEEVGLSTEMAAIALTKLEEARAARG